MSLSGMNHAANRWRDMAEEARTKGEAIKDDVARRTMKKVAEVYDRLAERRDRSLPLTQARNIGAYR